MSEPFIGEIRMFPYTFPPENWAYCNGQAIQIAQHDVLFAILGDMWGGDGRTTMGLPNLKARTPMHPGQGPGLSYYRLTQYGGYPEVTLYGSQIPSHTHTARAVNADADLTSPDQTAFPARESEPDRVYNTAVEPELQPMAADALANTGQTQPHENRQPFIGIPMCIALEGVFPPRN